MLLLIKYTLLYGIVLMLVALGGMFSEHSGIINIALEGIMVIGGVAGVLTLTMLPASMPAFATVLIAVLVAAIAGMVYSLLLAFASINLKADQTIGGTALNLLATAVAVVISKHFSDSGSAKLNYSNKPFLFSIGGLELSIFVPLGIALLIISYIVLYKTRFGLRLRACGEHPQAADSVGINVYKMRYAGVVISGALGAIGGLAYRASRPDLELRGRRGRCRLPCSGCYDLWSVEALPHLRRSHVLCRVQESGQHRRLHLPRTAPLVQQHLQHDALRGIHGHSGLHFQEQHGPQGRGYPLRQGLPLIRAYFPGAAAFPGGCALFASFSTDSTKQSLLLRENLLYLNYNVIRLPEAGRRGPGRRRRILFRSVTLCAFTI